MTLEQKYYEIDYSKVNTIEDIVEILKVLRLEFSWSGETPDHFKRAQEKGILKIIENKN